jgi:hypothetical protein
MRLARAQILGVAMCDRAGERDRGITQLVITPADVTVASAQLHDSPWARLLGGHDFRRPAIGKSFLECMSPSFLSRSI